MAEGSSANYNLLAQLDEAGLEYSDVEVEQLQPADALAAFTAGHVDAWAIWEPFTSQAEIEADAQVIADGETLANGYVFQVASDDALDDPATQAALQDYLARIAAGPGVVADPPGGVGEGLGRGDRSDARTSRSPR